MLDLKFVRKNPEKVREAIKKKNEKNYLDRILELDEQKRKHLSEVEQLRSEQNKEKTKISQAKKQGEDASELIAQMAEISKKIKTLDSDIAGIDQELSECLLWLPNIPKDEVPEGGEQNNVEIKHWGEVKEFSFPAKPHWDLGKELKILDIEKAAQISGSGFTMLTGDGAYLQRALTNFMLDCHRANGYMEVAPPYIVNRQTITNTAQLPKLEDDMYYVDKDGFFLVPTAEVPLSNYYQGEILAEKDLPIYLAAATPCFRREAGTYGKDTRGLLRVHQFQKVEMVHMVRQEDSDESLELMLSHAEAILQKLGLTYRVMLLASADLSFASAKTYDLEIWAPGVERWLEVSSCSTCTDFQSRRANIRYKDKNKKNRFVHLLNGSGVALPRLIVALLENYQRADGHIDIPEVLHPYFGGKKII